MTISLITPGIGDLPWGRWISPVQRGLRGAYVLGGTEGQTIRNHANQAAPLAIVGSPVFRDNCVRCTGLASYLATGRPETPELTYMVVAKMVTAPVSLATGGCAIGNYAGAGLANLGASLYADNGTTTDRWRANVALNNGGTAVSAGADVETAVTTNWSILTARAGDSMDLTKLQVEPSGLSGVSSAWPYDRAPPTANTLRIGSAYSSLAGQIDVAFVAIFGVVLTDAEVLQERTAITALMDSRGIDLS